jgi:hypothetical protein
MDEAHLWEKIRIFPGVQSLMQSIMSDSNNRIVYITSRPEIIRDQTVVWFRNNGLPLPVSSPNDIYDLNQRVVLLMADSQDKKDHLRNVSKHHFENDIVYFENDPEFILHANNIGVDSLYAFDKGYMKNAAIPERTVIIRGNNFEGISIE